eukprot:597645-Amphidinium_carterae.1
MLGNRSNAHTSRPQRKESPVVRCSTLCVCCRGKQVFHSASNRPVGLSLCRPFVSPRSLGIKTARMRACTQCMAEL